MKSAHYRCRGQIDPRVQRALEKRERIRSPEVLDRVDAREAEKEVEKLGNMGLSELGRRIAAARKLKELTWGEELWADELERLLEGGDS